MEVHHLANLMWAVAKLGANPLDGAFFQECIRQILPRFGHSPGVQQHVLPWSSA